MNCFDLITIIIKKRGKKERKKNRKQLKGIGSAFDKIQNIRSVKKQLRSSGFRQGCRICFGTV